MSQKWINGLSIYIDMRNSTKLNKSNKVNEITALYKSFANWDPSLNNMDLKYTSLIGDGILLFFKYDELNKELFDLLSLLKDKIDSLTHDNIKYGIGLSYGKVYNLSYKTLNDKETKKIPIGTSIDLAAKASNLGNKMSDKLFCIFLKNKKDNIQKELNLELRGYIESYKQDHGIVGKNSSSGNNYRFDYKH